MCKIKLKNVIIFLAGAEFFHTLSHIVMPQFVKLPLHIHHMVFTSSMNEWAIGVNALITIVLLWWACKLKN